MNCWDRRRLHSVLSNFSQTVCCNLQLYILFSSFRLEQSNYILAVSQRCGLMINLFALSLCICYLLVNLWIILKTLVFNTLYDLVYVMVFRESNLIADLTWWIWFFFTFSFFSFFLKIKQTSTIEGAVEVSVNREICVMILTVFEGLYDFGQER